MVPLCFLTKNICNAIEQTYSEAKTAAQVYALKVKTVAAKQGRKSVTEYGNHIRRFGWN